MSEKKENAVVKSATITDQVLSKINKFEELGQLQLPSDYSAANALKAAFLVLETVEDKNGAKALAICTRESISKALLTMVTDGLSVAKKQCYFVVYGNELTYVPSYFGTITIAKRTANVKDATGQVVYDGDTFKYGVDLETGRKKIIQHDMSLDNIDNEIKGAYAIITYEDGSQKAEVMSIAQVRKSWGQGGSKGNSPAHKNFPDQMAIKTAINRALKIDNASSNDSHLDTNNDVTDEKQEVVKHNDVIEDIQEVEEVEVEQPTTTEDTPTPQQPEF